MQPASGATGPPRQSVSQERQEIQRDPSKVSETERAAGPPPSARERRHETFVTALLQHLGGPLDRLDADVEHCRGFGLADRGSANWRNLLGVLVVAPAACWRS